MKDLERAIIFIDGNNFRHGMRKHNVSTLTLDYVEFSEQLTQGQNWLETRYYIGAIRKRSGMPDRYEEQREFLAGLAELDKVNYFLGRLERRPNKIIRPLRTWLNGLKKRKDIIIPHKARTELREIADGAQPTFVEKAVDTMIAVDMVAMAFQNQFDVAYLVSADGDFVPAVEKVRQVGKKVFVAAPTTAHELGRVADSFIVIKRESLRG